MAYDLYPAVDENYNFPPEVRAALAKSVDLRQTIIPMTTTERNNLAAADKWDGRFILNTDLDRIQRYDAGSSTWSTSAEAIDAIMPMTTAVRDNLSGVELFNGRMIFNTDDERIQRYDSGTSTWRIVGEVTDSVLPSANGTSMIGTSTEAARADHAHSSIAITPEVQTFTASGTWTKPADALRVLVEIWGGGGGGVGDATNVRGGGGGGGGYTALEYQASELPASVPVTIGAGGAPGALGGTTSFGSYMSVTGGGIGIKTANNYPGGGRGGGVTGGNGATAASPGDPGVSSHWGGGGGGGVLEAGGSVHGGGGGASGGWGTADRKGYSEFAGAGGNTNGNGVAPAGGGGGGSAPGSGARGQARITTYF